ncbi:S9 family peptidase [Bradyrhizobium sp.]|uniref:alpha/beta hydrolase family protein n=1 Tax=Bradyrhizobium sp. TaxID=376 RepID=UPI0025C35B5B|nr:alpha/beta hydrolase [Bradyrhizobium sp.]
MTASCIDVADDVSWFRAWKNLADVNCNRGNVALSRGHRLTARSNWLRAINYYQAAAFPFDREDEKYREAIARMRECAGDYLRHRNLPGETVRIAWTGGHPLEGYFLPATAAPRRAPAIICVGEPGQRKEEYLHKVARHAAERGMALLAVDLFGAGEDTEFGDAMIRPDLETAIGCIMDHVAEREDVDPHRIAVLADSWSSSFVARGLAFDDRFAAAVCDGGIWDLHERAFLRDRLAPPDPALVQRLPVSRAARNIKCPVLVTAGERGWLRAQRIREFAEALKSEGRDVTLKIFTIDETAAAQGHADNPTLANEFIFDWVASRLGICA